MHKLFKKKQRREKAEFTYANLPATRFAQFFDLLKVEWRTLIKLGFLTLVFFIPFFAVYFLMLYFASIYQNNFIFIIAIGYVCLFATLFIETVNLSGMANVIKNMIYGEGVLFKDDYFEGIKKNYGQFAIIAAISGLFLLIIDFSCRYVFGFDSILPLIFSGICKGFLFLLFIPVILVITSECAMYEITLKSAVKNSFILFIYRFYQYFIVGLVLMAIDIVFFISNFLILLLVFSIILLLVAPLLTLSILLISTSSFDVLINKDSFNELYRKGLKKEGN